MKQLKNIKQAVIKGTTFIMVATLLILAISTSAGISKVMICHYPSNGNEHELSVPPSAINAHIGHGDHLGPCSDNPNEEEEEEGGGSGLAF